MFSVQGVGTKYVNNCAFEVTDGIIQLCKHVVAKVTLVPCSVNLTGKRDTVGHGEGTINNARIIRVYVVISDLMHYLPGSLIKTNDPVKGDVALRLNDMFVQGIFIQQVVYTTPI